MVRTVALISATCLTTVIVSAAGQAHWLDVPFVQQPDHGCGAATVAMVMQYWEQHGMAHTGHSGVDSIQRAIYSKQAHGAYASQLQRYLDDHSFTTFVVRGDDALLAHHLAKGRPLIVALKPTSSAELHYVVVAGIDPAENIVLVNDPARRKLLKVETNSFNEQWKATGNWTLLAVPRSGTP